MLTFFQKEDNKERITKVEAQKPEVVEEVVECVETTE